MKNKGEKRFEGGKWEKKRRENCMEIKWKE